MIVDLDKKEVEAVAGGMSSTRAKVKFGGALALGLAAGAAALAGAPIIVGGGLLLGAYLLIVAV